MGLGSMDLRIEVTIYENAARGVETVERFFREPPPPFRIVLSADVYIVIVPLKILGCPGCPRFVVAQVGACIVYQGEIGGLVIEHSNARHGSAVLVLCTAPGIYIR